MSASKYRPDKGQLLWGSGRARGWDALSQPLVPTHRRAAGQLWEEDCRWELSRWPCKGAIVSEGGAMELTARRPSPHLPTYLRGRGRGTGVNPIHKNPKRELKGAPSPLLSYATHPDWQVGPGEDVSSSGRRIPTTYCHHINENGTEIAENDLHVARVETGDKKSGSVGSEFQNRN